MVMAALWIGYVSVWGERASLTGLRSASPAATSDEIRLSPDFTGPGLELTETTARPLFNPSRRPLAGSGKGGSRSGALPRGRYELTGVSISPSSRVAMLLDVTTKKTVRVEQGKELDGILVEAVTPNKITLKLGTDSEELPLKIAAPKPAAGASPNPGEPSHAGQAAAPGAPPSFAPPVVVRPVPLQRSGVPQSAVDVANADPITEADVAEREARTRARRDRRVPSDESAAR